VLNKNKLVVFFLKREKTTKLIIILLTKTKNGRRTSMRANSYRNL